MEFRQGLLAMCLMNSYELTKGSDSTHSIRRFTGRVGATLRRDWHHVLSQKLRPFRPAPRGTPGHVSLSAAFLATCGGRRLAAIAML